ncbi:MAG: hypothetical protein J6S91_08415, partial [Treponema sp.]|nr:hypothetical protein [Treponema sp.]
MKQFMKILMILLSVIYPVIVFVFLYLLKTPVRVLSVFVIIVAAGIFLTFTARNKDAKKTTIDVKQLVTPILLLTAGLLCFLTNKIFFLKLYSVFLSAIFLGLFGSTLFFEPTMIFRFATLADKSIIGSTCEDDVRKYCRVVTILWCLFFILNGTISTLTAFSQEIFHITEEQADKVWTIYNGALSYVLMGLLFSGEYLVRIIYDKHLIKAVPISKINQNSRKESQIICQTNEKKSKKTWGNFLAETEFLRNKMSSSAEERIILDTKNAWNFLTCLCVAIQSKKTPVIDFENENTLTPYNSPESVPDKTHNQPIPKIQTEDACIEIHQDGNVMQIRLCDIENKIDAIIQADGKRLVLKKQPCTIIKNDPEKFLEDLLLHFTLGIKIYTNLS